MGYAIATQKAGSTAAEGTPTTAASNADGSGGGRKDGGGGGNRSGGGGGGDGSGGGAGGPNSGVHYGDRKIPETKPATPATTTVISTPGSSKYATFNGENRLY